MNPNKANYKPEPELVHLSHPAEPVLKPALAHQPASKPNTACKPEMVPQPQQAESGPSRQPEPVLEPALAHQPASKPKIVWIIGDSHVRRSNQRAVERGMDHLSLSNARVLWFGCGGLRWERLVLFFNESLRGRALPDVLLINCGGNDLGFLPSVKLVNAMKEDLLQLHRLHPGMQIILSAIPQRRGYRAGVNPAKLEKARKFVNNVMATFILNIGGVTVAHPNIRHDNEELFRDQVNFSPRGYDIFINNLVLCLKDLLQTP